MFVCTYLPFVSSMSLEVLFTRMYKQASRLGQDPTQGNRAGNIDTRTPLHGLCMHQRTYQGPSRDEFVCTPHRVPTTLLSAKSIPLNTLVKKGRFLALRRVVGTPTFQEDFINLDDSF